MKCLRCAYIEAQNKNIPESLQKQIRTKKAKFYGELMGAVIKAGGYPKWFRSENLKYVSIEKLLNNLTSNGISFKVELKEKENGKDSKEDAQKDSD